MGSIRWFSVEAEWYNATLVGVGWFGLTLVAAFEVNSTVHTAWYCGMHYLGACSFLILPFIGLLLHHPSSWLLVGLCSAGGCGLIGFVLMGFVSGGWCCKPARCWPCLSKRKALAGFLFVFTESMALVFPILAVAAEWMNWD